MDSPVIFFYHGVMVSAIGNGHCDQNSNPGWDFLNLDQLNST